MGIQQLSQELKNRLKTMSSSSLKKDEHLDQPDLEGKVFHTSNGQIYFNKIATQHHNDHHQNFLSQSQPFNQPQNTIIQLKEPRTKSVTFSVNATECIDGDNQTAVSLPIAINLDSVSEAAVDVGNLRSQEWKKNIGNIDGSRDNSQSNPILSESHFSTFPRADRIKNRTRNIWEKITSFAHMGDKSINIDKSKQIIRKRVDSKDIKVISPPIQNHPNLHPANLFCYDNPSFLSSLQLHPHDGTSLPLNTFNQIELTDTKCNSQSSSDEKGSNISEVKITNMNVRTTSSQTNINIHPITSLIQSSSATDFTRNSFSNQNQPSENDPKQPIANGYITTSNVSSKAVVEVAKALRVKMQEQQKQKEQRHRYEMGNSSFRYLSSDRVNIIHCNSENEEFSQVNDGFISLQITPSVVPNDYKVQDTSSLSDLNHSAGKDFSMPLEDRRFLKKRGDEFHYFPNEICNTSEKSFSSFQGGNTLKKTVKSGDLPPAFSSLDERINLYDRKHSQVSDQKESSDTHTRTEVNDPLNNIVYAELSFPRNKNTTFKVFEPKATMSIMNDFLLDDAKSKSGYSTLRFPPPSPRKIERLPMLASLF